MVCDMIRHQTDRGTIHEAKAEDVYPLMEEGSLRPACYSRRSSSRSETFARRGTCLEETDD